MFGSLSSSSSNPFLLPLSSMGTILHHTLAIIVVAAGKAIVPVTLVIAHGVHAHWSWTMRHAALWHLRVVHAGWPPKARRMAHVGVVWTMVHAGTIVTTAAGVLVHGWRGHVMRCLVWRVHGMGGWHHLHGTTAAIVVSRLPLCLHPTAWCSNFHSETHGFSEIRQKLLSRLVLSYEVSRLCIAFFFLPSIYRSRWGATV